MKAKKEFPEALGNCTYASLIFRVENRSPLNPPYFSVKGIKTGQCLAQGKYVIPRVVVYKTLITSLQPLSFKVRR